MLDYLSQRMPSIFGKPVFQGVKATGVAVLRSCVCIAFLLGTSACGRPWNNPYDQSGGGDAFHFSFAERPKYLDPVRAYSSNEYALIGQIYEPPLQYHYLRRPYSLEPLTAVGMPEISYIDSDGQPVASAQEASFAVYEIRIKPGIRYQPHPAFARLPAGGYRYHGLDSEAVQRFHTLSDFEHVGTRELTAQDYVYQIKRLADPSLHSPVSSLLGKHVQGFEEFDELLTMVREDAGEGVRIDLREFDIGGVEALGRYRYRIVVDSNYPQFIYWLAMPFFAPIPWEADVFYSQPALIERNVTLNWYPVGTGAYRMTENNPNMRMLLERNPNYHHDYYPSQGSEQDRVAGLLADAGRRLPLVDKLVFSLEKESIPYWNKFLQGYYDSSGIHSDSFDQVININPNGDFLLSDEMLTRGISLESALQASIFYYGFNMLDPVVGGYGDRATKLRRALSIAVDIEEHISIFMNGRGIAAQDPIAPGVFGYREGKAGINPYVYDWENQDRVRKPIEAARRLMLEAGYEDGIDQVTGKPLVLYFDALGTGPDAKSLLSWMRKQFAKLDVQLVIRNTDYNRFQEKMSNGSAQIYRWGWNADYPDPENFLFLLYGPEGKVSHGGSNGSNYRNAEFDRLFERMKSMPNGDLRQQIIDRMVDIVHHDSPWIWGIHPRSLSLRHSWVGNYKPNLMAHNTLKYRSLDQGLRARRIEQWNQPEVAPLIWLAVLAVVSLLPAVVILWRRRRETGL